MQIGCNRQFGAAVVGFEADWQWSGVKTSVDSNYAGFPDFGNPAFTVAPHSEHVSSSLQWFSTLRGRVGYAFDKVRRGIRVLAQLVGQVEYLYLNFGSNSYLSPLVAASELQILLNGDGETKKATFCDTGHSAVARTPLVRDNAKEIFPAPGASASCSRRAADGDFRRRRRRGREGRFARQSRVLSGARLGHHRDSAQWHEVLSGRAAAAVVAQESDGEYLLFR